jgi:predicted acylesterase/phospholipase RssA
MLRGVALAALVMASACTVIDTTPINTISGDASHFPSTAMPDQDDDDTTVVALAFSGGGMRAAAFAYGALSELDTLIVDDYPRKRSLVDDVRSVAGTSGGAVMAAYLGYKGKDGYTDFRDRFLAANAEAYMYTSVTPVSLSRTISGGGANDRTSFGRWLDEQLFEGATYAAFHKPDRPIVWITASDIYNGTPFLFTPETFAALCSDLDAVKIADAVAASAAFPIAFSPVVLETPRRGSCNYQKPDWMQKALDAENPSIRLQAYARALDSYQSREELKYLRLLDGGLTDNLGIGGLSLERARAMTPYAPLTQRQAVRVRHFLFVVADAGVDSRHDWGGTRTGPGISKVLRAVSDTTVAASTRHGFDAVDLALHKWREDLINYRCSLSSAQVLRQRGTLAGWNCRDVIMTTEHLSFRNADPAIYPALNKVPTRLRLDQAQVDLVIEAGRQAVQRNANIQSVARDTRMRARLYDAGRTRNVAQN